MCDYDIFEMGNIVGVSGQLGQMQNYQLIKKLENKEC
jgi:hypothetical protein